MQDQSSDAHLQYHASGDFDRQPPGRHDVGTFLQDQGWLYHAATTENASFTAGSSSTAGDSSSVTGTNTSDQVSAGHYQYNADETVRVWETATGKERRRYAGHRAPITAVALAPDGQQAASAAGDRTVHLWETGTGKELGRMEGLSSEVSFLAFQADGRGLVLGLDGTLGFWDPSTGKKEFRTFQDPPQEGVAAVPFPDGRLVALAGAGNFHGRSGTIRLLSRAAGREVAALQGKPSEGFWSGVFSADSKLLATPSSVDGEGPFLDHRVRLWEAATGRQVGNLETELQTEVAAFSPDARLLAVADGSPLKEHDRLVHLWDLAAGEEIGQLAGHCGGVQVVAFSPAGRTLASGSADNTVLIWDVSAPALRRWPRWARAPLANPEALWGDLANADAVRAQRSLWRLVAAPQQAIPFLGERLRPVPRPDPQLLTRLMADLDSDQFTVREKATEELAELAELAGPALRQTQEGRPTAEVSRRIEHLLEQLDEGAASPARLRTLRAVTVLERIGTSEARQLLAELARGTPEARLTQEARASLERLARQPGGAP